MEADRAVAHVARRQHGVITVDQMHDVGLTDRAIKRRADSGRFDRMQRGVYRVAGSVPTFEQTLMATCLSFTGVAAASHRAAAELWSVDLPHGPVCEVTTTIGRSPRLPGVVVHRGIDLVPAHILRRRGIPVTNPLRLLVDLGPSNLPSSSSTPSTTSSDAGSSRLGPFVPSTRALPLAAGPGSAYSERSSTGVAAGRT